MKKLLTLLLTLFVVAACITSCGNGNNGSGGNDSGSGSGGNEKPDYGTATVYVPGTSVNIIAAPTATATSYKLLYELDQVVVSDDNEGGGVLTSIYTMNGDHEIVIGYLDETREATALAYKYLNRLERDTYFNMRYLIYAKSGVVAIAYDENEYTNLQVPDILIPQFIEQYISGREYIAFGEGIIAQGTIDLIAEQEKIDDAAIAESWNQLESAAGSDIANAFRQLYTLYGDKLYQWAANLYDPGIGAFYAASSGRDGAEFGPDIENGVQLISFFQTSGMLDNLSSDPRDFLPKEMQVRMIYFAKSLQAPNGYFYHPQWQKSTIDSNIIRRSRDLGRSANLLTMLGSAPTYNTPTGVKGDGISADKYWELYGIGEKPYTYDKSPNADAPAGATASISTSVADAVSKAILTSQVVAASDNTEYLKDHKLFIDYVLDDVIPGLKRHPYSGGSGIGESVSQIRVAGNTIGPYVYQESDGERYKKYDGMTFAEILVSELDAIINPNTGFWGDIRSTNDTGTEYYYTNGFMKTMALYNGLNMPYPEKYAATAARSLMKSLVSDEPSTGNICEVYNVWVSITRLVSNLDYIKNEDVKAEVRNIVDTALKENAAQAILISFEKIKGYQKYDGGFSHSYTKGTPSHSDMPVATGKNQSDVDATCIGSTGLVREMFSALGLTRYRIDMYTESDWMRVITIFMELDPVIKYSEEQGAPTPVVYTFDEDINGNKFAITADSHSIVTEENNGVNDNKLLLSKIQQSVGASFHMKATQKNPLANMIAFEADVKYDNLTAKSESQLTFYDGTKTSLSTATAFVLLTFGGTASGSKIFYSDFGNGADNGQRIDTGAVVGEWFKIRIELYSDGTLGNYRMVTYVNGKHIYTSNAIYSKSIVSNPSSLAAASGINGFTYAMNMKFLGDFYFDNVSLIQQVSDITNIPGNGGSGDNGGNSGSGDSGGSGGETSDTQDSVTTNPTPIISYDSMPATDVLQMVSRDPGNIFKATTQNGDGALYIRKTSAADGSSGVTVLQRTTETENGADVAIFTADVLLDNLTKYDAIQITAKGSASSSLSQSPILILLNVSGTAKGSAITYTDYNNGNSNNQKLDTGATVGTWFNIRIEYRVIKNAQGGVTGIIYKTFINNNLICTGTGIYGTSLSVNGGSVPVPDIDGLYGVNLSFNRSMIGDIYVDNSGLIKATSDYEIPASDRVGTLGTPDSGDEGGSDNEGGGDNQGGTGDEGGSDVTEPSTKLTFDNMPSTDALAISLGTFGDYNGTTVVGENSCSIVTEGNNKALLLSKGSSGRDAAGTIVHFAGAMSLRQQVSLKEQGARYMIFDADIKATNMVYSDVIQFHLNAGGVASNASPLLGLLTLSTTEGAAIKHSGAETSAKIGEWFHLRVIYAVTATDSEGNPTAVSYSYIINTDGPIIGTTIYKQAVKVEDITSFSISFNSKNQGDFYIDNMSLRLVTEDDTDYEAGSDNEGGSDVTEPEADTIVNFDTMPPATVLYTSVGSFGSVDGVTIVGENSFEIVTEGENKVLHLSKGASGRDADGNVIKYSSAASVRQYVTHTDAGAKYMIFDADIKATNMVYSDVIQFHLNAGKDSAASASPLLGLLTLSTTEGAAIKYSGTETSAKIGEWFRLRVIYTVTATDSDGNITAIQYKYIINDDAPIEDTKVYKTAVKVEDITSFSISFNSKNQGDFYIDNVSLRLVTEDDTDYDAGSDNEGGSDVTEPETETVVTFDSMPAATILSTNVGSFGSVDGVTIVGENSFEIVTEGEDNVLHLSKGASGRDADGNVIKYSSAASVRQYVTQKDEGASLMVFEADIKATNIVYSDVIQFHINAGKDSAASASPLLGLLNLSQTEGAAIMYSGAETSAKIGEWFHLRVEYRVTATDESGNITAIQYKYFINDDAPIEDTKVYKTAVKVEDITSFCISFNSKNQGDFYIDDVSLRLIAESAES